MIRALALLLCFAPLAVDAAERRVIVVVGSEGTESYGQVYRETVEKWRDASERGDAAFQVVGNEADKENTAERFREAISSATEPELWIVLIGHGSFDTRTAKFNVAGPDFTDTDLAEWVRGYPGELAVINTASSSGSFLRRLSGERRIVVTATKNEAEQNYTRFGIHFADAIGGLNDADLDNDGQVSILEAFLFASNRTAAFYESEGRLATEHSLLDDNGDERGSRAEWFEGTTSVRTAGEDATPDGDVATQKVLVPSELERRLPPQLRARRDELEREVKSLRRGRDDMAEKAYYEALEPLLLELARIYEEVGDS